jgi:addiction module RelE/StbE family toxin
MRTLLFDQSFRRAAKRTCKNQPQLRSKMEAVLSLLEIDPFSPALRTHKLKGDLEDLGSYTVEYDCRIVFRFHKLENEPEDAIVLINIGSHDEVY